ncbi:MAG: histone deacetylase [Bacteroidota bacterium]
MRAFHSDRFVPELPPGHRFPIQKYQLIREQLLHQGILTEDQLEESTPVAEKDILRVHTKAYWQGLHQLSLEARAVRKIGFPLTERLVDRSRRSCQGTFRAAEWALEHGVGMNIAGGTHHAYAGHGEGFCVLNDIAISALSLLATQKVTQILIIDLDVHQGNGNAVIFQGDPRVFTFSMHGAKNYPLRKELSDLDVGLPNFTRDAAYLQQLQAILPKLIEQVKPDLIYYQAGVDVLETDKLGKLSLSRQGCKERDQIVLSLAHRLQIPLCLCMGGGYSHRVADTVDAHVNTFRVVQEIYG